MKKDIREAIKEHLYANAFATDPNNPGFVDSFFEHTKAAEWGADWRINSVWHDVKELPENNTWFLAQIGNDCFDTFTMRVESDRWKQWCKGMNIIRWSYIKDLLPNMED